ncbi:MAG: type II secretion system protein GspM [Halofilum sp. (in: g-proteobacteria)]|nr:type II secretion system protein GspM [Halofilum sp. (in: g-proteobacteria)]
MQQLEAAIDARDRRERLLLAGACLVVLLLAWDALVRAPLSDRIARDEQRIEQLEQEARQLEGTLADIERQLQQGGDGDDTLVALQRRIERIDTALAERTMRVISPRQMVAVLRDMLQDTPGLSLMALRNQGSEPLITEPGDASENVPRVFRHRVEVVVRGDYFAVQKYLQRLEGLDWQFQWDGLVLETVDYPKAEATLSISTLSLAEDWIGV